MKSLVEPLEARIAPAGLSIADASINEGNSGTVQLQFTVSLDSPQSEEVTVQYSTADGTAISTGGSPDFAAVTNQTLTFAVGETSKTISIEVNGDNLVEANQAFTVTLSNPSGGNTLSDATATGTINNDDTAVVSIAAATDVTEGNGVTSVFTVSLSNPLEAGSVTVDFRTGIGADTAKPAPGAFTDYAAQSGTLTFAAGETSKQVSVAISNDTFREDTEQFTVTLSNARGATLGSATAVGRILNDSDTTLGLTLPDVKQVEGNTSTGNNVILTPTLSARATSPLTFNLATKNGTAIALGDYTERTGTATIAANALSTTFSVPIIGDTAFESTESFFVNLTGATGVTVVNNNAIDSAAQATARVYLYNDDLRAVASNRIQWVDVDGDLVTLSITNGSLFNVLGQLNTNVVNLSPSGTVGGQKLTLLNVNGGAFFGTSISITAAKQPGFPGESDGRVDIGAISAMVYDASELQAFGIDLGTVKIDGDLARISAGDSFSTPAIGRLEVYSLGARGTANLASGDTNLESLVLGPVSTMLVEQNVESYFHVVGSQFGTIGTLKIGGELKGNDTTNSGRISVSGRISNATIGAITGGTGQSSGVLSSLTSNNANSSLGNITILGDITGGGAKSSAGADDIFSGAIVTPRLDSLKVGNVIGGGKERSGIVLSTGGIGKVTLTGDLVGGSGKDSGVISADTTLGTVVIDEIRGGTGEDSGTIVANTSIAALTLDRLIGGSGKGSGSVRAAIDNTGAAVGGGLGDLGTVKILGKSGSPAESIVGGNGANSGRIDARGTIRALSMVGDLQGGTGAGSGAIKALAQLGTILVDGVVEGGGGDDSGTIVSNGSITSVTLDRLAGGAGKGSGAIRAAIDSGGANVGSLVGNVGKIVVGRDATSGDSVTGATGTNSGRIDVRGSIGSITLAGDLQGGAAGGSGVVKSGVRIDQLVIKGDVRGADSGATNLGGTGAIVTGVLKSLVIEGDLVAGKRTGAGTISTSGAIRVDSIDSLWVKGDLVGDATNSVFITAAATGTAQAMKNVRIDGSVNFAEIRAGYRDATATSADAQIGTVTFGGTVKALNLIAGAQTGADNVFGVNDQVSSGTGVVNNASVISSIASVIFKNASAVQTNPGSYGIVAQLVGSITQGAARTPVLTAGAGNDTPGKELAAGSNFRALELAV